MLVKKQSGKRFGNVKCSKIFGVLSKSVKDLDKIIWEIPKLLLGTKYYLSTLIKIMTNPNNVDQKGVALGGYDPVSYFGEGPIVGNSQISSQNENVTYYFASEDNKAKFESDPQQYIPQYGGFCAVAVSEGKLVPVDPQTYKITDNKLYLFYNGEFGNTKPQWEADEATMKAKADAQWQQGDLEAA